mmetsp:Transcript_131251/g.227271  ORF Transcript_131251/g.227271 Transcript_131251/m.227271 type:complete len:225 (+) Transcript_131251:2-676(+)
MGAIGSWMSSCSCEAAAAAAAAAFANLRARGYTCIPAGRISGVDDLRLLPGCLPPSSNSIPALLGAAEPRGVAGGVVRGVASGVMRAVSLRSAPRGLCKGCLSMTNGCRNARCEPSDDESFFPLSIVDLCTEGLPRLELSLRCGTGPTVAVCCGNAHSWGAARGCGIASACRLTAARPLMSMGLSAPKSFNISSILASAPRTFSQLSLNLARSAATFVRALQPR